MDKIHGFDRTKEEADKNKWLDKYIEQAIIIDIMVNNSDNHKKMARPKNKHES